jgi:hypothetical protein
VPVFAGTHGNRDLSGLLVQASHSPPTLPPSGRGALRGAAAPSLFSITKLRRAAAEDASISPSTSSLSSCCCPAEGCLLIGAELLRANVGRSPAFHKACTHGIWVCQPQTGNVGCAAHMRDCCTNVMNIQRSLLLQQSSHSHTYLAASPGQQLLPCARHSSGMPP